MEQLADALRPLKKLKKIDVSRNEIGGRGAVALGNLLASLRYLEDLNCRWNWIGGHGATELLTKLLENVQADGSLLPFF